MHFRVNYHCWSQVRLLLLAWMFVYGVWIFISIILPPALILMGWVFSEYARKTISGAGGPNYYTYVLNHITNINSFE